MTQRVQLPDGSIAEFPDEMSSDQITGVIKQHLGGATAAPAAPTIDPGFLDRYEQTAYQGITGKKAPPLAQNAGVGSKIGDYVGSASNYLDNLASTFLNNYSFGTSDEVGALARNISQGNYNPFSTDFWQQFAKNDKTENAALSKFKQDNPVAANTANIAGLVTSPFGEAGAKYINAGPNLVSRLLRGGAVGAATSGGLTFANAEGDVNQRAQNVPLAALTGFPMGMGGTAAGEALSKILPSGTANEALRAATNDPTGEAIQRLAQQPGVPAANDVGLADLLKGAATQAPGAASQKVPGALSNLEQGYARTAADIDQLISPQNSTQLVQSISDKAREAADKGYKAAYALPAPQSAGNVASSIDALTQPMKINIPQEIINRPSFQDALPIAQKLAAEDGRLLDVKNLTTEDADYIQRALKALKTTAFNSENAAQNAMGSRYGNMQDTVLSHAESANPVFAQTRQSYAEAMGRKDAVQKGLDWMKPTTSADDIATEFSAMSPAEQEAAKAGFATKLKNVLAAKPTRQTPTRTLDTNLMIQKLQAIGVDPQAIEDVLTREQGVKQVYDALTGGSDTARKLAIQKSLTNPLSDIRGGDVAAAALTSGGAAVGLPALRATGGVAQRKAANYLVNALADNGPGLLQALIAKDPRYFSGLLGSLSGRVPGAYLDPLNQKTGQ